MRPGDTRLACHGLVIQVVTFNQASVGSGNGQLLTLMEIFQNDVF